MAEWWWLRPALHPPLPESFNNVLKCWDPPLHVMKIGLCKCQFHWVSWNDVDVTSVGAVLNSLLWMKLKIPNPQTIIVHLAGVNTYNLNLITRCKYNWGTTSQLWTVLHYARHLFQRADISFICFKASLQMWRQIWWGFWYFLHHRPQGHC